MKKNINMSYHLYIKNLFFKYDGLSLDNGCTFYSLEELDAVNKELQVNISARYNCYRK